MFKFDFIDAAAAGYRFVIIEHQTLYHLALIPFLVKLVSFVLVVMLGLETAYLTQGLILLPSYFVEGWLIAQVLRLAVLGERWPGSLSGDQEKDAELYQERQICLKSSMIVYVLIKLIASVISGLSLESEAYIEQVKATSGEPNAISYITAIAVVMLFIWAFRLLWLYIPMALGQRIGDFLRSIKPYSSSVYMMGTWVLCAIPVAFLLLTLSQGLGAMFGLEEGALTPPAYQYIVVLMQAFFELFTAIVSSVAIAYTIATISNPQNKNKNKAE